MFNLLLEKNSKNEQRTRDLQLEKKDLDYLMNQLSLYWQKNWEKNETLKMPW